MPEVKIFMASSSSYDDEWNSVETINSISDWETITEEEYNFLKNNLYRLFNRATEGYPVLLRKDSVSVHQRITSIKELIAADVEKERKRVEENTKRLKKAAEKREENRLKRLRRELEKNPELLDAVLADLDGKS
ncbi:hypothetical protein FDI40_gp332 [Agrobacterium phage Atu_ph07]|uniref:Uncharacterized protein n=1 Tax=Agrobacterium phage Atu_ph07 TaxID=2024264 RepID=A0A2L0UZY6_9CAUD|nr:hypothetical protein FDI40_gp332 [Agrobacterium phage Atu_ph07]AUZ95091.1 hypothetical protein [Agrobacterium phage Atu_ph07]